MLYCCFRGCPIQVEEECPLEPTEVEELRCVNDYPPSTFESVLDSVRRAFPSGRWDYYGGGGVWIASTSVADIVDTLCDAGIKDSRNYCFATEGLRELVEVSHGSKCRCGNQKGTRHTLWQDWCSIVQTAGVAIKRCITCAAADIFLRQA